SDVCYSDLLALACQGIVTRSPVGEPDRAPRPGPGGAARTRPCARRLVVRSVAADQRRDDGHQTGRHADNAGGSEAPGRLLRLEPVGVEVPLEGGELALQLELAGLNPGQIGRAACREGP